MSVAAVVMSANYYITSWHYTFSHSFRGSVVKSSSEMSPD